jgi:hypothetical protein
VDSSGPGYGVMARMCEHLGEPPGLAAYGPQVSYFGKKDKIWAVTVVISVIENLRGSTTSGSFTLHISFFFQYL